MRGLHCFFYPFTDLGWHALEGNGSSAGPRQEGFIWHSAPGCVHLPADTRVCFHRCDNATCMLQQVIASAVPVVVSGEHGTVSSDRNRTVWTHA